MKSNEDLIIVHYTLPVCELCGSGDIKVNRTDQQGDGSKLQSIVCKECKGKFKIAWEFPACWG